MHLLLPPSPHALVHSDANYSFTLHPLKTDYSNLELINTLQSVSVTCPQITTVMWWHALMKITFEQTDTHAHAHSFNSNRKFNYEIKSHTLAFSISMPIRNGTRQCCIQHEKGRTKPKTEKTKKKLMRVICSYHRSDRNLKAAEHPCIRSVEVWIFMPMSIQSQSNNNFSKFLIVQTVWIFKI